jgi:hypothetical protein
MCIQSDLNERALPCRSYRLHAFQYHGDESLINISLFRDSARSGNAQPSRRLGSNKQPGRGHA